MVAEEPNHPCHCIIHEPPGDGGHWDENDPRIAAKVQELGWIVGKVDEVETSPGWAFTVGLWHSLGRPELAMVGLRVPDMQHWLSMLGIQVRDGQPIEQHDLRSGILPNHPVTFRLVHGSWYEDLFGYLIHFAQRPPLPLLQVVWPDRNGRFPWDASSGEACRFDQPQLWLPKDEHPMGRWTRMDRREPWPFPAPPETRVVTSYGVAYEGQQVMYVVHDLDGTWEFRSGRHRELGARTSD